ncbi:peptide N-acetyl-beta-D-glucosaminyl asparaginase amidase A-domain-containing protein [Xylariales sp. PMI_506]|nr:peptide N-acetyl-beta-D-glucosaminyl asparaginase amidase A-domain-containing protein [Xylariales sp. PMI_506]
MQKFYAALLACSTASSAWAAGGSNAQHATSPTATEGNLFAKIGQVAWELENLKHTKTSTQATTTSTAASATATSSLEEIIQVAEPILLPSNQSACTVVVMDYHFANSYGAPYVGNYTPPTCDFDHVAINFTVEIAGVQFDRWGSLYFGDIELFSTSTAEPTRAGIRWEYLKDVTPYLSLWKEPQTVIFNLDNIVDSTYTGILNTTLTATFFKSTVETGGHLPADLVLPISAELSSSGQPSYWTVPDANATTTISDIPRNVNRAVVGVNVKGQGNEEFWWSNVPQSVIDAFDPDVGTYPGYGPWREVQIFIDGQLAGVHWPFPIIFTGGVVPQLHRPIVGLDTYDLRDHEIDITPWLPLLCDGESHTFELKVVGLDDNGSDEASISDTINESWYIVGKIFLWLDSNSSSVTTGTISQSSNAEPTFDFALSLTQNATGFNETLDYTLSVSRSFTITSDIKTEKYQGTAKWTQSLEYSNLGSVYNNGWGGVNTFSSSGVESATSPGWSAYKNQYTYPLFVNSTESIDAADDLSLWAVVDQGLVLEVSGSSVYPTGLEAYAAQEKNFAGSVLRTWNNGTANYFSNATAGVTSGVGATNQTFYFGGVAASGAETQLYWRDVSAYNNTIVSDVVKDSST